MNSTRWIPQEHQRFLLFGMGVTSMAAARALLQRGHTVDAFDDAPSSASLTAAESCGLLIHLGTDSEALEQACSACDALVPAPGLPDNHRVFATARAAGLPVISEFDLAAWWDSRPKISVTGTNGKTTVTTLITEMLIEAGIPAMAVGNTEVPLVQAISDPSIETFVIEASSFRLAHTQEFHPQVAVWLNFAEDHLDVHRDLQQYRRAKARSFTDLSSDALAVVNLDDEVVAAEWGAGDARFVGFTLAEAVDQRPSYRCSGGWLVTDTGEKILATEELPRSLPIDCANALAAASAAHEAGASLAAIARVLRRFSGLPHRVSLIAESGGVRWFDDSKATAPHAVAAAVGGFDSVVLIAGGRNKGLDLSVLTDSARHIRAVIGIGEAGPEICEAFAMRAPAIAARSAESMDEAVELADALACPGDVVLLSPGCASFDWYRNYSERGDHFAELVRQRLGIA